MSLLRDPYELGQAIGVTVGAGVAAYFLAKQALPERRSGAVARLMKKTGVADEGDEKRSRWVPPPSLIAVFVAVVAGVTYVGLFQKPGFNARDLAELRRGFDSGCNERCVSDGGEQPLCQQFCTCTLAEIAKKNKTDEDLVEWFNMVKRQDPMSMKILGEVQQTCIALQQSKVPSIR